MSATKDPCFRHFFQRGIMALEDGLWFDLWRPTDLIELVIIGSMPMIPAMLCVSFVRNERGLAGSQFFGIN